MAEPDKKPVFDTEAMMQIAETFRPIIELAAGHRAAAEAQGFAPAMAEAMGTLFHNEMIHSLWEIHTATEVAKAKANSDMGAFLKALSGGDK